MKYQSGTMLLCQTRAPGERTRTFKRKTLHLEPATSAAAALKLATEHGNNFLVTHCRFERSHPPMVHLALYL